MLYGKREKGSGSEKAERKVRESECATPEKRVGKAITVEADDGSASAPGECVRWARPLAGVGE